MATWDQSTKFLHQGSWSILSNCIIHIPAITVTVVLVALNACSVYYEDIGSESQNFQLNAFQFAAKIHEILIIFSLSNVAITIAQFELFHGRGLPVTGVLIGFQISDLSSLWSLELWRKCLDRGSITRHLSFVCLIMIIAILAAIVGPSSAILMLPSIGWWSSPYELGDPKPFYFIYKNAELWPTNVTTKNSWAPDCDLPVASMPFRCPANGLKSFESQSAIFSPGMVWNFTVPVLDGGRGHEQFISGVSILGDHKPGEDGGPGGVLDWFYAQTTSKSMTQILVASVHSLQDLSTTESNYQYALSLYNGTLPLAPQTVVICNQTNLDSSIEKENNFTGFQLQFPLPNGDSWYANAPTPLDLWNTTQLPAAFWVAPSQVNNQMLSIGAVSVRPIENAPSGMAVHTCSIFAGWFPTEIYLQSTDYWIHSPSNITYDNIYFPNSTHSWIQAIEEHSHIKIDLDWANVALPPEYTVLSLTNSLLNNSAISVEWPASFGSAISMLVTDGLSRISYEVDVWNPTDLPSSLDEMLEYRSEVNIDGYSSSTAFKFTQTKYGYSYTLNSKTRILSAAVLLFHVLIALIHTTLVLWFGWSCPNLRSLRDLLLVAVNSSPPGRDWNPPDESPKLKRCYTFKADKEGHSEVVLKCESPGWARSSGQDKESMGSVILRELDKDVSRFTISCDEKLDR